MPVPELFSKLAESIVNPKARKESLQHYADIINGKDPFVKPPMMDSGGMMGTTGAKFAGQVLDKLVPKTQYGKSDVKKLPDWAKQDLADAVRFLIKAVPKDIMAKIKNFSVIEPKMSYPKRLFKEAPYGQHKGVGGDFAWFERKGNEPHDIRATFITDDDALPYTLAEHLGHEITGHGGQELITSNMAKTLEKDPMVVAGDLYWKNPKEQEKIADLLRNLSLSKANLPIPKLSPQRRPSETAEVKSVDELREAILTMLEGQVKDVYGKSIKGR